MKVKRQLAAFLALAMVVTGQPVNILAGGVNSMLDTYAATRETDTSSPSDATEGNTNVTEDEIEKYKVTVEVKPEDGATVDVPDRTVETGDTLKFSVKVKNGYELDTVLVTGTDTEGEYNSETGRYEFTVEDISEAPEIEVYLNETEYPEYETSYDIDGVNFTVKA